MIPSGTISELAISDVKQPSRTYGINTAKNVIGGYIDGLDSVRQAVELIMSTERYIYPIYSWNYGVELERLVGKDALYITAEIKRRIREALEQDDRVNEVSGFKFTRKEDELLVEFDVVTDYGNFRIETAVSI
jgi:hypothetical protein